MIIKTVGLAEVMDALAAEKEAYMIIPITDETPLGLIRKSQAYGVEPGTQMKIEEYISVTPAMVETPDETEESEPEKGKARTEVDHGKICALYKAKPPWGVSKIAEECGCSVQTVINHLQKEGIYRKGGK